MSETFVLAQCTSQKADSKSAAAELYEPSAYFRLQRAYAKTAELWAIQSAKHGLLWPETAVAPYNRTPDDIDSAEAWAADIAAAIDEAVGGAWTVELLGGAAYADPLTPALEARGYEVHEPLRGLGIGERMAELKTRTTEVSHATLHE
jgi:GNAT superfamily N-acetyltransferase